MKKILISLSVFIFPLVTFAAGSLSVFGLFTLSQTFIKYALNFIIALAIVWFIWNIFRYIISTDEIKTKEARDAIIWGIVAIFVMVSIWGLVAIFQYTFNIFPSSSGPNLENIVPKLN